MEVIMLSILSIILALELSMADGTSTLYNLPTDELIKDHFENNIYLTFDAQIFIYEYFYVKGSAKILMYASNEDVFFFPAALSSFFEIGYTMNGLSVFWRHECTHPLVPHFGDNDFSTFADKWGDEIGIQFKTQRFKVF